jgi:two-component system, OmpR family, aerobic respiration control sensor histidine kinase ArcB
VKDTGIGIPKDKQAVIFEKFERLSASYQGKYKGSGLGLFAVKTLAEELGGNIELQSEAGQGATFTSTIPMLKPTHSLNKLSNDSNHRVYADATMTSAQQNMQVIKNKYNILLVEDDAIVQMVTISLLENRQCEVDVAVSGQQAIAFAENNHYDLIFMDLGLPDMYGYQVTQMIRSHPNSNNAPIVALTAHAAKEVQEQCLLVGMNEVCSKPLSGVTVDRLFNKYIA